MHYGWRQSLHDGITCQGVRIWKNLRHEGREQRTAFRLHIESQLVDGKDWFQPLIEGGGKMRVLLIEAAVCFVVIMRSRFLFAVSLLFCLAHPVLAQSQQMGPGVAKPGTLQGSRPSAVQAQPNGGVTRPTKVPTKGISRLTEEECTTAGGRVFSKGPNAEACQSGKTCITFDENKTPHSVCISKSAN
jgi:hypothetical protein